MKLGTWAKAGGVVGLVAKSDPDGTVTIFNPGDRQMITAPPGVATPLPTGTVDVQVALRMEVPHGLSEDSLKRWLAALIDPVIRTHAQATAIEKGLDDAAFKLDPTVLVTEVKQD